MNRSKEIAVRKFERGLNLDIDAHRMPEDQYRDAFYMEGGYGRQVGAKVPMRGTREAPYSYPVGGVYSCIGSFRDDENETLIFFIVDQTANKFHHMMEYDPSSGLVTKLVQTDQFEFERDSYIQGRVVDGVAYFVDGNAFDGNLIAGREPRAINLDRFRSGKRIEYEVLFNEDCYQAGVEFSYTLFDLDGNVTLGPILFYTSAAAIQEGIMLGLFNALIAQNFIVDLFPVNTIDFPARRLTIRHNNLNTRVEISAAGPGSPEVVLNELNYYPLPSSTDEFDQMIALIKPCPPFAPIVEYVEDPAVTDSDVFGYDFQFRHRYIYVDGERSAWGPASRVPTNVKKPDPGDPDYYVRPSRDFTKIELTFDIFEKYLYAPWRSFVRKVEVAVRNSETDPWRLVDTYDLSEFFHDDIRISFLNTETRQVIPSDDNGPVDAQSLKNFDQVPRVACGVEVIYDEAGNSLLALGGGLYDYNPQQFRGTASVVNTLFATPPSTRQDATHKGLKRGGRYKVGITFKDYAGRQSSVQPFQFPGDETTIKVPFSKFNDLGTGLATGYPNLRTEIATPIPTWADYWQIAISKNLNQDTYYQIPTAEVKRMRLKPGATAGDYELEENAAGDLYGFGVSVEGYTTAGTDTNFFEASDFQNRRFIPAQGDRLQVMYWEDPGGAAPIDPGDIETYNYPVVGYSFADPSVFGLSVLIILIEAEGAPDFRSPYGGGSFITYDLEIYRPGDQAVDEVYWEFGPIIRRETFTAIIEHTDWGDTYFGQILDRLPIDIGAGPLYLQQLISQYESKSFNAYLNTPAPDFGRPVVYDPSYQARSRYAMTRHSDIHIPGSERRGLSSFRGTDFFNINAEWGPIRGLVMNQNVLLVIASRKTQPVYVSKDRMLSLNGSLVGRTDRVFNVADEVKFDMGTIFPESIVYEQGVTYAYDYFTGRYWRYDSGSGQFPISDYGMIGFFQEVAQDYREGTDVKNPHVVCGFDRKTKQLFVSTWLNGAIFKEEQGNPHWVSRFTFLPTNMDRVGQDFVVFQGGILWVLDEAEPRAEVFGVQQDVTLTAVINDNPDMIKEFDNVEIHSNRKWHIPEIKIPAVPGYTTGMESRLIENKWSIAEGALKADFLRDATDPRYLDIVDPTEREVTSLLRGRPLRGEVVTLKLQLSEEGLASDSILRSLYVYYRLSKVTVTK